MKLLACSPLALAAVAVGQTPSVSFLSVDAAPEGDGPLEIAWTADGSALLVVNRESGNVAFLDPVTQRVTDVVPVGTEPLDVELTPSGQYALVPNSLDDDLSLLDVAARAVVAKVPLTGSFPYQVEVDSTGTYAVVACTTGSVSLVDIAARAELMSFPTVTQYGGMSYGYTEDIYQNPLPSYPRMDLGADDRTLILAGMGDPAVEVYDVLTGSKLGGTSAVFNAVSAALDPTLRYGVFTESGNPGLAYVLDLQTWQTTAIGPCNPTCSSLSPPEGLVLSPTGTEAVVAGGSLGFVDIATATDLGGPGDVGARAVDVSANGAHLLAVGNGSLQVVDVATRQSVARLEAVMGNRIAAHPTLDRFAVLNSVTDERVHWFEYSGVSISELGSTRTGPPAEGDGPVSTASDAAGRLLMTANYLSDGVTVFDTDGGTARWIVTGDRPVACALDAAGEVGAVLHASGELAVVDPLEGTWEARVPIGPEPAALAVASDGSEAYVLDSKHDSVTFVALAGAASRVVGTLALGGDVSPAWLDHRARLSSQGLLAVPLSAPDQLLLVDVSTRAVVAALSFGAPPVNVVFSRDGRFAYVSLYAMDRVVRVRISGAGAEKAGGAKVPAPRALAVDASGQHLYVDGLGELHVLATVGMTEVASLPLHSEPLGFAAGGAFLFINQTDGLQWFRAAGPATQDLGVLPLGDLAYDLLAAPNGVLYAAEPHRDGVEAYSFGASRSYCGPAAPNSTGQSATASAQGWNVAGEIVVLAARDVPPGEPGYFLASRTAGFVPFAGGSQGHLCLGGSIGRFPDQVQVADSGGTFSIVLDTTAVPQPEGPVVVEPGETWHFQAWFRDHNPGPTSNFTDGAEVTFE